MNSKVHRKSGPGEWSLEKSRAYDVKEATKGKIFKEDALGVYGQMLLKIKIKREKSPLVSAQERPGLSWQETFCELWTQKQLLSETVIGTLWTRKYNF